MEKDELLGPTKLLSSSTGTMFLLRDLRSFRWALLMHDNLWFYGVLCDTYKGFLEIIRIQDIPSFLPFLWLGFEPEFSFPWLT